MSIEWKPALKQVVIGTAIGFAFAVVASTCAKAETVTVRIVPVVPTVAGIEASRAPAPAAYPGPVRTYAPSADVIRLRDVAPPNGCPAGMFNVVSGPKAQRGCY